MKLYKVMEIPNMIIDVAKNIRSNEVLTNTCKVGLHFFNNNSYEIFIIPSKENDNVMIKYKKLNFKCKNMNGYDYVCRYILDSIKKEIDEYVKVSIEWDGYDPDTHDNFDKNVVSISVSNTIIFKEDFKLYSIPSTYLDSILRHILPLYYLTIEKTF